MPELPEIHNFKKKVNSLSSFIFSKEDSLNLMKKNNIFPNNVNPKRPDIFENLSPTFGLSAQARGKEFSLRFDLKDKNLQNELHFKFNLGLVGKFDIVEYDENFPPGTEFIFVSPNTKSKLILIDIQKMASWSNTKEWGNNRGPDPIDEFPLFKQQILNHLNSKKFQNTRLCELLLDQQYFNGIGNYLRSEMLFRSKVDPFLPFSTVFSLFPESGEELLSLCRSIPLEVLDQGLNKYGTEIEIEKFENWLQCYGKKNSIKDKSGRTFWYDSKYANQKLLQTTQLPMKKVVPMKKISTKPKIKEIPIKNFCLNENEKQNFLSSYLKDPVWKKHLESEWLKPYFQEILQKTENSNIVLPPKEDIFTAFNLTPLDKIKVVILGQDPYHDYGQAHGLCFSVLSPTKPPPSLINIYSELKADIPDFVPPKHGNLSTWAERGVFLLNSALTVEAHKPNSHANIWKPFTAKVIEILNERLTPIVFLAWGAFAQKALQKIDRNHHIVLESAHPSPLSASRFFGCRIFSKANQALQNLNQTPIDWSLPEFDLTSNNQINNDKQNNQSIKNNNQSIKNNNQNNQNNNQNIKNNNQNIKNNNQNIKNNNQSINNNENINNENLVRKIKKSEFESVESQILVFLFQLFKLRGKITKQEYTSLKKQLFENQELHEIWKTSLDKENDLLKFIKTDSKHTNPFSGALFSNGGEYQNQNLEMAKTPSLKEKWDSFQINNQKINSLNQNIESQILFCFHECLYFDLITREDLIFLKKRLFDESKELQKHWSTLGNLDPKSKIQILAYKFLEKDNESFQIKDSQERA